MRIILIVSIIVALFITACDASTMAEIRGPARIQFGYTFANDEPSIIDETTIFHVTDEIKMLINFGSPPGVTHLDRMLSQIEGEFESVIDRSSFDLATGRSKIIRGVLTPAYFPLGPGHYRLRILKNDTILAEGEFDLIE